MAIEKYGAELLALLKNEGVCLDRFLMLGRQNFFLHDKEVSRIEELTGFPVVDLMKGDPDEIYAESFLERLGVGQTDSMDFADYEGCTVIHDMNQPIPQDMEKKYDVVYDGGTLEHIFNFPVAIENCMKMVRKGGYFLSFTGSNNYNGHGFYQFSPELYFRLFNEDNGFQVKLLALGEAEEGGDLFKVEDAVEVGARVGFNFGSSPVLLVLAAKRFEVKKVLNVNPQQSDYSAVWKKQRNVVTDVQPNREKSSFENMKIILKKALPRSAVLSINKYITKRRRRRIGLAGLTKVDFLSEIK